MDYEVNNRVSLWTTIKRFLLGVLLITVIVFILLWLFPTKSSLNPLFQDVFRRNIESMRDAGEKYFTNERMPKNIGDKIRITLGEMLDKNLLLQFTDKNGKFCSNTESYIEVTKKDNEYEMKVNLSCPTEEAFIIVPLGCTDRCEDCKDKCETCPTTPTTKPSTTPATNPSQPTPNKPNPTPNKPDPTPSKPDPTPSKPDPDKPKTYEYEFMKMVYTKELAGYDCPTGYKQDPNNKQLCYKNNVITVQEPAKVNKTTQTANVIKNTTYKYQYTKTTPKKYSAWSDWSADKVYTANDNIVWGEQELIHNAKNGYSKKTITTTAYDKTKPIYQVTNDNVVGTYKQYVCSGYTYFKDSVTSKVYQTGDWVYSTTKTFDYVPSDTNTTKYVYVGMDFDKCSSSCTLKPYYIYKVYTRTIKEETRTSSQLSAVCKVEEKTINVYGMKKTFVGYLANKTQEVQYTYYYHTKTRTVLEDAKTYEKWSSSANDTALTKDGYKYTGKKEVASTTTTCPTGYTLNSNKTKCEKVVTTYTCPTGKLNGKVCNIEKTEKLTKNATPKYKTVQGVEYKWAKTKTLSGWTPTGRVREA